MSRSSLRIPAFLRSSLSLVLAASLVVGAGAAETPKGSAAATGALSVTTDPDNAEVYVDGRLAGQTPANVPALAAGEHRVRIVKSGYLENARIVTVASGQPTRLNVKLTKTSGASNETAGQVTSTGGGGGGGGVPKWVWFAAAGGAAVAVIALLPKNKPPVPGTISVTPTGTGMAGQTSYTFRSVGASDPDGDALTRTWRFSDNTTATGETVTKTFATAGTFQANLEISDGKETATAPAASVTVGPNLTGTWTGGSLLMPNSAGALTISCAFNLVLTQSGTSLTGQLTWGTACSNLSARALTSASVSVLTHPAGVSTATESFGIVVGNTLFPNLVVSFSGTTSGTGTTMNGNVTLSQTSSGFTNTSSTSLTKS